MIRAALHFTKTQLNQFVKNEFSLDEDMVIMNSIINPDGSLPVENQNKIICTLIHTDVEANRSFSGRKEIGMKVDYSSKDSSKSYNIRFLVTSNFDNYEEALRFLDTTLKFFRLHSVFNQSSEATLPEELLKITIEPEYPSPSEMQNLWQALGAKLQPSFMFRARVLSTD